MLVYRLIKPSWPWRGGVLSDVVVLDTREMRWARRGEVGRAICSHTAVPWIIGDGAAVSVRQYPADDSAAAAALDKIVPHGAVAGAALVFGGFTGAALHGSELLVGRRTHE